MTQEARDMLKTLKIRFTTQAEVEAYLLGRQEGLEEAQRIWREE